MYSGRQVIWKGGVADGNDALRGLDDPARQGAHARGGHGRDLILSQVKEP